MNHSHEDAYDEATWLVEEPDDSKIMVIHTLTVHPLYFKNGVARALMDFSLQYSRAQGMKSVRLDVHEKNAPAIALYKKCNFSYITTVDLGLEEYGLKLFMLFEFPIL